MRSFIALLWDNSQQGRNSADRLRSRIEKDLSTELNRYAGTNICVYELSNVRSGNSIIRLRTENTDQGAVFGTLFPRLSSAPTAPVADELSRPESRLVCTTNGQHLLAHYWGSYVAFLQNSQGAHVISDPTSSLPCFYLQHPGLLVVLSHLEKCTFLDRTLLTINYDFVRQLLAYDKILTGETGLQEVSELPGGTRLSFAHNGICLSTVWDPRDYARDVYDPPIAQAADEIRNLTMSVVGARSLQGKPVTVRLSGGLDSSIVLACARAHLETGHLNTVHHHLDSDDLPEDRYARLAADHSGTPLTRIHTPLVSLLPNAETTSLTARPQRSAVGLNLFSLADQPQVVQLGNSIFTGQGGDHLFLDARDGLGFADFALRYGLREGTLTALLDSSRLAETTVWRTLGRCFPYLLGKQAGSSVLASLPTKQVASNATTESDAQISLPTWVTDPSGLPPGKFQQVNHLFHLVHVRETLDMSGDREVVHPLVSQPLIELCLRLPVYRLCAHGQRRGLARLAFKGMIPEEIRTRTTKGSASRYFADTVDLHRQTIVETLMDGCLVKRSLLDRDLLADFLRADLAPFRRFQSKLLTFYAIEIWLARWERYLEQASGPRDSDVG